MLKTAQVLAGVCLAFMGAAAPRAQVLAFEPAEMTRLCTAAAKSENPLPGSIRFCTEAIEHETAIGRALAGLYVNRSVLEMRDQDFASARQDLDAALAIAPYLGEAWVDHGAVQMASGGWGQGVLEINRGLNLMPDEPEKAYYNRAMAREHLDDLAGAYSDYVKAAELSPQWSLPREELKRFHVTSKPAS